MGICLNKTLQDEPQLKIARKGIVNEESFYHACQLCDGHNPSCSENYELFRVRED